MSQNPQPTDNHEEKMKVFLYIRTLNRNGKTWNMQTAQDLADTFNMPVMEMNAWGTAIYAKYAEEHNSFNGSPLKRIEAFLNERYVFRRNALTRKVMYRPVKGNLPLEPCRYNDIWRELQHNLKDFGKTKIPLSDVQTLLESDFVKDFHPIHAYFKSLKWDGGDHIQHLADHVKCEDQQFWCTQFRKCLVRMIACSFDNIENRIVMTLYTKEQNIGKNRFIRFLVPSRLREYFKEDPLLPNKDSEIALTQNFIWHLDELEALNKNDMASLKSFISRSSSKQRMAYARQEETRNRIVNFWASTNKEEFLTDWQNTRWLIFHVSTIDWGYNNESTGSKAVDIDQVWAQAWALYQSKSFNYHLDESDRRSQDNKNKNFETASLEKQYIMKYLTSSTKDAFGAEFMQATDVLEYLLKQVQGRITLNHYAIKPAMAQLGFEVSRQEINKRIVPGWWVIKSLMVNGSQIPLEVQAKEDPGSELPF